MVPASVAKDSLASKKIAQCGDIVCATPPPTVRSHAHYLLSREIFHDPNQLNPVPLGRMRFAARNSIVCG